MIFFYLRFFVLLFILARYDFCTTGGSWSFSTWGSPSCSSFWPGMISVELVDHDLFLPEVLRPALHTGQVWWWIMIFAYLGVSVLLFILARYDLCRTGGSTWSLPSWGSPSCSSYWPGMIPVGLVDPLDLSLSWGLRPSLHTGQVWSL
jgi:hypothetical protein